MIYRGVATLGQAMAVNAPKHSLSMRIIGVATVLMVALAAGAVWCVLQLYARVDLIGISLLVGVIIAIVVRRQGFARSYEGLLLAVVGTTVACAYASFLLAAAKVASFLGIPMRSALTSIGPDMAGAVAWAGISGFHLSTLTLAIVLSAWLVWRKPALGQKVVKLPQG